MLDNYDTFTVDKQLFSISPTLGCWHWDKRLGDMATNDAQTGCVSMALAFFMEAILLLRACVLPQCLA